MGVTSIFPMSASEVYVSALVEQDDDLPSGAVLRLDCYIASELVCTSSWPLTPETNLYTMWFDLGRIEDLQSFERLPMTCELQIDDVPIIRKEAVLRSVTTYNWLSPKNQQRG